MGQAFGLEPPTARVEVYDNSHIMGTNADRRDGRRRARGLLKNHYRTFNIKRGRLTPGDDFGMMREVLTRRFARLMKEGESGGQPSGAREPPTCRPGPISS